ncbi:MAG TPA: CRTAC1 family protein [Thermoanaerobaculia bacterium]|nr:CRTAC1 family protein [Thermoanaerobaculia bacterium]
MKKTSWSILVCLLLALPLLSQPRQPGQPARPAGPRFTDVTAASGIKFTHNTGAFGKKWLPETMGPGVVLFDANGDDRLDVLFLNGRNFPGKPGKATTQELYTNQGGLKFANATAKSGLGIAAYCLGGAAGDLDNDGDADLYLSCVGQDYLLRNDGGKFADVSAAAGLSRDYEFGASVALLDADKDGRLDVLATRYVSWTPETDLFCTLDGKSKSYCTPESYPGASPRFYRNKGAWKFEDATKKAGISKPSAKSLGVAVLDLDGDGWPDLAVANDTQPNLLYRNRGNGTFEEVGVASGMAFSETGVARGGMGIDAADYDRSGRHSLVIGNFANEMVALYRNEGNQLFVDVAPASQIGRRTLLTLAFAAFFFDYDLDGWLDILLGNGHLDPEVENVQTKVKFRQPTQLFRNAGAGRYEEVTATAGGDLAKPRVARGAAYGDLDNDGDLDLVLTNNGGPAQVFANAGGGQGRWLKIGLEGSKSNRDGLGTVVEVTTGGATQRWLVRTGSSYLSQSQVEPIFGLGRAAKADRVVVRWPSGKVQQRANVAGSQRLVFRESGT